MSENDWLTPRKRRRHLLIVEGYHEKNRLLELLLRCFPEIDMELDDVLIYGTNIYKLYQDIIKEYQEDWDTQDVDLPFLVSRKKENGVIYRKNDFINIILIFDYERHDPNFSEEKILRLQKYFNDATDVGCLYINYPMVESYQDFEVLPDDKYADRYIPVTLQPGRKYKECIRHRRIAQLVGLPAKIQAALSSRFGLSNEDDCRDCVEKILEINSLCDIQKQINSILLPYLSEKSIVTATYQFVSVISQFNYLDLGLSYFSYMRGQFLQIIHHNIRKANKIANGVYDINDGDLKECFLNLDFSQVLDVQNKASRNPINGLIWILNTCVFFIPDYNFRLIM